MKNKPLKNIPPVPSVLMAIISVQGGAAIAKGIFPLLGAASTAALRIGLSSIILVLFNRPSFKTITPVQWKAVIPYGIALGAMNATFYLALSRIPLGLAVTLEFIGPLLLAVLGSKRAIDFIWVFLAAIGIALIAPWDRNSIDLWGALLALLAGGFWAAYIILGGRISKIMDGGAAVSVGMLVATLVVLPFALFSGTLINLSPALLGLGLALALLSSAIPFTLEMNALKHIPARTFSILMSLEPAVAALCGLLFLHEHLSFFEWTAIALVVIASTGAAWSNKKVSAID
jgi:inner membrane transporter RhtA